MLKRQIIKNKMAGIKLILVGSGRDYQNLQHLVIKNGLEKEIKFTGNIINSKISEYMTASDIFVLPSISEGMPIVILEAMASGLPVVATRVGGIPEIIQEGENGYLVDAKNSEQIAAKISYLFSHGDAIKHISLQNIEKAKEYSWNLVGGKLLRIYSDCVKDT